MPERYLVALDLGTSGCRAALYRENGERVAEHYREYETLHRAPGGAEQRPQDWWEAACACLRAVVHGAGAAERVVALGISAQGHSWVPVDGRGEPLRPALTWLDTRAAPQAAELLEAKGAAYWGKHAGKLPGAWHLLPQLLWLRATEPHLVAEASRYLFAHDYLIQRLVGEPVTDFTTAAGSLLLDTRAFAYNTELLAEYKVPSAALAPLAAAGAVAGTLTAQAAEETGLSVRTIVAIGAQDQKCAALGAGIQAGMATASLGTSTAITAQVAKPLFAAKTAIPCFPYLREGTWVLEAPMVTTGAAYRWVRGLLRQCVDAAGLSGEARVNYKLMDELVGESRPGAAGVRFYPFLAGAGSPHWKSETRGTFSGLALDTGLAGMVRAVLEGVAFEVRTNVEAMRSLGAPIEAVRVFGGGARSHLWVQMIADVLRLPVELCADIEAAATGAAMLAGVAAGVFGDLPLAQVALGARTRRFEPGDAAEAYDEAYWGYREGLKESLSAKH